MNSLEDQAIQLLNYSAFAYLLTGFLFFLLIALVKQTRFHKTISFSAQGMAWVAFALHTAGLLMRWYIGGIHRPPWTNLYESLIFFSWGAGAFQLWVQHRWKFPSVGVILMPLVFLVMGMGVMTPNKDIEPLVPSLQSNWLKIHVAFGMISYAGFTVAACFAFFHLMKNNVAFRKVMASIALLFVFNLSLFGGSNFFVDGKLSMARTVERKLESGKVKQVKDVYREYEGGPLITRVEEVKSAKIPFILSLSFFMLSALSFLLIKRKNLLGNVFYYSGIASSVVVFMTINSAVKSNPYLTWHSNPYMMMLLFTTLIVSIIVGVIMINKKAFLATLPAANRLEELSYKAILFAFPFQTLLLITGAIWAYYAWGRSWGWDPKETWALITWFAYLIYLHGKLLLNWRPNILSIIAIVSFVVMVFAFLGVNLVLSGLHSYGAA